MNDVLLELSKVIEARKSADSEHSYVAKMHRKGLNKILEKVGEEATETLLAAKDMALSGEPDEVIHEVADLWFHTMLMLSHLGIEYDAVLLELERRFGTSGVEEKRSRQPTG